jgi:hypothetical protein
MRQLYVKRWHPLQLALHIWGNISSNNCCVNHEEIPLPLGSRHSEACAAHFVADDSVDVDVGVGVVIGTGADVGGAKVDVVPGVGAVVGGDVAVIGAEHRA